MCFAWSGIGNLFQSANAQVSEFNPALTAEIYREILEIGLKNLQRFRIQKLFDYLAIEIDHLHNIPTYIVDSSLVGHGYYFCTERDFYIERLADIAVIDTGSLIRRYQPHWDALRKELLPYAAMINAHTWHTKL